jgi:glycosyltransferase 2 family protein
VSEGAPARRPLWRVALALAGTVVALTLAWRQVDTDALAELRNQVQWVWVGVAAALVPAQVALAALRWRHISARLGHPLTPRRAISEYALSTILNQVLPGGIAGDLLRVWRQRAAAAIDLGGALRAAVVERWSGQAFLGAATAAGLVAGWVALPEGAAVEPLLLPITAIALVLLGLPLLPKTTPLLGALAQDARVGVMQSPAPVLALTLALHLSLLGGFAACAMALGHPLGVALWVAVPLVLMAMAVPLAVAGWGPRELGAMFALPWFGWTPTEAFALAVLFGIATLVGSLPGALVPLMSGSARE